MNLKTEALNSHSDLGINAAPKNRMTMRFQATCAPLSYSFVENFITRQKANGTDSRYGAPPINSTYEYYMFGNWSGDGYTVLTSTTECVLNTQTDEFFLCSFHTRQYFENGASETSDTH